MIMLKPLTLWITINWEIIKDTGILDLLTCLLIIFLFMGQDAILRTGHRTTD